MMRRYTHHRAILRGMRTTVQLDDDVAAAVEQTRREGSMGLSEAVNQLIRQGLVRQTQRRRFHQRTHRLDLSMDVSNVAEALDLLDGPDPR